MVKVEYYIIILKEMLFNMWELQQNIAEETLWK